MKADEPQVGQQHEDVKRKRENYHIIFPERTLNFYYESKEVDTIVTEYFNSRLLSSTSPDLITSSIPMNQLINVIIVRKWKHA